MSKILSGKIKKIPSSLASPGRYDFLSLGEAEPDAGLPSVNNGLFASDTDGTRKWLQIGNGLEVDVDGNINVITTLDASLVTIDPTGLSFTTATTLNSALIDLSNVLLTTEGLLATFIAEVVTDETLVGVGTVADPLGVSDIQGRINIQNRNSDLVSVKLTKFLYNCLRIDSGTFREDFAKVYTRTNQSVNVLV